MDEPLARAVERVGAEAEAAPAQIVPGGEPRPIRPAQWAAVVAHYVNAVSLRQAIAPERMQGRVNGTMRFVSNGLKPVGSLAGGVLGGVIGLPLTLVVGEVGMLLAVGWYLTSPVWATRDLPEPLEEPG